MRPAGSKRLAGRPAAERPPDLAADARVGRSCRGTEWRTGAALRSDL